MRKAWQVQAFFLALFYKIRKKRGGRYALKYIKSLKMVDFKHDFSQTKHNMFV